MSRLIEFRCWNEHGKCFHGMSELGDKLHLFNNKNPSYVIEQFTELLDFNGAKIFEGDIVRDHNGIGEVQYSDKKAAFKVNYHDGFAKWFIDYNLKGERESIEVIGNIHQNSELLK